MLSNLRIAQLALIFKGVAFFFSSKISRLDIPKRLYLSPILKITLE